MTRADELLTDVAIQIRIFGYAQTGPNEFSATVAERGYTFDLWSWDKTADELAAELVCYGTEPMRRVKDFAALRWVAEHCIRGHEPWPGL